MKTQIIGAFFIFCIYQTTAQTDQSKTTSTSTEVYTLVEETAEYPGGITEMTKFIQSNLHYPDSARKNKIGGKCFLKFIVNESGNIEDVTILKNVPNCVDCDNEAMRVVKAMPTWKPAKLSGRPVKCYYNLPISFKP